MFKKYVYINADNYIEKELLGNLYERMNNRYENIVNQLQGIVKTLVGGSSIQERQLALLTLKKYILLEKHYIRTTTLDKDKELPENENSGLTLKWFGYVSAVMFRTIPSYYKNLNKLASRFYSMTRDNKYRNDYKISCKFVEKKFTTIIKLIQSDIFGDYIEMLTDLETLVRTYEPMLFDSNDIELNNCTGKVKNLDTISKLTIENMYNYKDLNELANEHDFIKIGQTGSHAQFKHLDGRLITIPQGRNIGKGLSIKIQKDIKTDRLSEKNNEFKTRRLELI
ncbi:hypothetical protein UT300012_22650 [Paraclostridium bifermentans]